jgi:hypothetical protein
MNASKKMIGFAFCYKVGNQQKCHYVLATTSLIISAIQFFKLIYKDVKEKQPITTLLFIKVYQKK